MKVPGKGSDVALETADIALMADKLETLPFAIRLSKKAKGIIRQSLGSTLVVVFNALMLLAYRSKRIKKANE